MGGTVGIGAVEAGGQLGVRVADVAQQALGVDAQRVRQLAQVALSVSPSRSTSRATARASAISSRARAWA